MIRFTMTLRDWHLSSITLPTAAMWLGFCFPKCFPISLNLSSRNLGKSFKFSRTPFLHCNSNGESNEKGGTLKSLKIGNFSLDNEIISRILIIFAGNL